ncbi:MAG: DNA polymerase I [Clostridiales bacterium]|nr:DNA polymerase I [Clostridiales bacterium]
MENSVKKDSLIVIDANSLVNRAFFAMPGMTTTRGEPVGAVYGFSTMLIKLIEQYRPKYVAAAFDVHAPTFRHRMSPLYKATRKPMPTDLAAQMDVLKALLADMRIKMYEKAGYEADDLIGTIARCSGVFTYILTGDRDSLQLVNPTTHALLTKKGITEILEVSPDNVKDVFGVPAERVIDFKALAGDSSDNIPGVAGIGEKSAVELITTYGSLDGVYAHLDEIKGSRHDKLAAGSDNAYLSYNLARIDTYAPIDFSLSDCELCFPFPAAVKSRFTELEFRSLLSRDELFTQAADDAPITLAKKINTVTLNSPDELHEIVASAEQKRVLSLLLTSDGLHTAFDGETDYFVPIADTLMSVFTLPACIDILKPLINTLDIITFGLKSLLHEIAPIAMPNANDVALMAYLLEYRLSPTTAAELFALRGECEDELTARGMTKLYRDIELPLLHVLFDMERLGFAVDRDRLNEIDVKFSELEKANISRIRELSNSDINLNSPKQLAKLLFEDMGIPYPDKSAKTYSTKAEILQKLSGDYEIVDEILKYRFNSKLKSTFIDGVRKALTPSGTVHTRFNQTLTTTGRLSSTDPNLQNIPTRADEGRLLRSMFVGTPGNVLVDADYSQIELKLLAHFSGDPKMVEAFRSGGDIHASTAAEVFEVAPDEVTPQMRRDAKAVNFGIVYGISNYGLSQNIHIPPRKADEYIKRYFERFPAVKAYLDGLIENAKKQGYAVTMFGRRRTIPELNSAKFTERKFGERVAMNTPLQGSAADIIKIAMVRVHKRLEGMKSNLIMQVHDELIVDTHPDEVEQVKEILKTEMENAVSLSVPLNVDIAVGRNWMECK